MAEIPFIDTHVHFHDMQNPRLRYSWLEPGTKHAFMGDIEAIQSQRYWADDFIGETRFANVRKSIHVQAALGIPDPVEETKWLQAFADRLGHPHGIVAEVHLAQDDAPSVIERHMAYPNVRGVRDFGPGDYLVDPAWQRGYGLLEAHDLVACLDSSPETYAKMRALAEKYPNIVMSVDHAGVPRKRDPEYFAYWKRELETSRAPRTWSSTTPASAWATCAGPWTRSARGC